HTIPSAHAPARPQAARGGAPGLRVDRGRGAGDAQDDPPGRRQHHDPQHRQAARAAPGEVTMKLRGWYHAMGPRRLTEALLFSVFLLFFYAPLMNTLMIA